MNDSKIVICGDFVAQRINKIKIDNDLITRIKESNYAICNFEAPIHSNGQPQIKSGPAISQSEESPQFLENIGFNAISIGNNHIMDYGHLGLESTIKAFRNSIVFGAGSYEDVYDIKILKLENICVGVLSLVQYEFGIVENRTNEKGTAWILSPKVENLIIQVKTKVDYLLILPHAGLEDCDVPLPEWREVYKNFVDLGANAVIASHPHVPQGWEVYKGAPIFYSLGNFYFDSCSNNINWYRSFMIELFFSSKLEYNVVPLAFTYHGKIFIDRTIERKDHIDYINSLLYDNDKYDKYISAFCDQVYKSYSSSITRAVYSVSFRKTKFINIVKQIGYLFFRKPNIPTLLNLFRCESHRWAIQYALKKKIK